MNEFIFRDVHFRDTPYLKRFWQSVFPHSESALGAFFESYVDIHLCALAQSPTKLAAMGFLFPVGELIQPDAPAVQCALAYAIAVDPEFRGNGLGSQVVQQLLQIAEKHRFGALVVRPEGAELFEFYEKCGLQGSFGFTEKVVNVGALPASGATLVRLEVEDYRLRREALLLGTAHVAFDRRAVLFQSRLLGDGGLFAVVGADGAELGVAAVELDGGALTAKELLLGCEADADAAVRAIADEFGCTTITVRMRGETPFGLSNIAVNGYLGFAFD